MRATSDQAQVLISSEFQLDNSDVDALFLHVSILDAAPVADDQGFTLTDMAVRVRKAIVESDAQLGHKFDALLTAAGFAYQDDYTHDRWVVGGRSVYRVTGDFPRLTPSTVPGGIGRVKYTLSLADCDRFLAASEDIDQALIGTRDAF